MRNKLKEIDTKFVLATLSMTGSLKSTTPK